MTKRKKRSRPSRQGIATLRQRGHQAFQSGEYSGAIEAWERIKQQPPDTALTAALAEAYFRRGLEQVYGKTPADEAGLSDLRRAAELQPDDLRYTYHVGLASQHRGDLSTAMQVYERVRKGSAEFASRAAYPLALGRLQQGEELSAHAVWSALTENERAMLRSAGAFRRRPYSIAGDAPPLWQGIAALDAGESDKACDMLNRALAASSTPVESGVAHYYLGVLAALAGEWDKARQQWSAARAAGLDTLWLSANLGELYHQLAEERLVANDLEGALDAANEAARHLSGNGRLNTLIAQIHQRLGYQAASAGRWSVAHDHWQKAYDLEGGSFRLAYNLALAYEKAEEFISAGETWREALRRRPRRTDHPDAISDEQVALIWKRAAEAYVKAGEYDEAIYVYKQAVKWNPDGLETRIALVDGLINDGRFGAAQNELERILDKDRDYVPALLRMAETLAAGEAWWRATEAEYYWKRVLELEPNNAAARQGLVDYYIDRGNNLLDWGYNYADALRFYNQALALQPQNGRVLALLGGCYLRLGDVDAAHTHLDAALVHGANDLDVYDEMIRIWLSEKDPDRAWQIMNQAEARISAIPFQFYLAQGLFCLQIDPEMARPWLERTVEKAPPGDLTLLMIGETLMFSSVLNMAEEYLLRAVAAGQNPGDAYVSLGMVAIRQGDTNRARQYLREADKIAQKTRDKELAERVQMTRSLLDAPPALVNLLLSGLGERMAAGELFPDFLDEFDEYDDEEYADDDGFFDFFRP